MFWVFDKIFFVGFLFFVFCGNLSVFFGRRSFLLGVGIEVKWFGRWEVRLDFDDWGCVVLGFFRRSG